MLKMASIEYLVHRYSPVVLFSSAVKILRNMDNTMTHTELMEKCVLKEGVEMEDVVEEDENGELTMSDKHLVTENLLMQFTYIGPTPYADPRLLKHLNRKELFALIEIVKPGTLQQIPSPAQEMPIMDTE